MKTLTTGLAALALLALGACDRSPTALDAPAPGVVDRRGPGAPPPLDGVDDAADRLLPAIAATSATGEAREIAARMGVLRAALHAGDARAAATALDAALGALDHSGADAADLDAMRLDLESARARLRPRD